MADSQKKKKKRKKTIWLNNLFNHGEWFHVAKLSYLDMFNFSSQV